jgi:hypothetical protein
MDDSFFKRIYVRKFSFVLSKPKYAEHVNVGNGIVYNLFIKDLLTCLLVVEQGKNDFETITSALKGTFSV